MRVLDWIWGWIWDNRKWVFDGFGVAVIIAIGGVVWNWYYSPDGERNQADEPKVYLQEQSPDEVAARINSLNRVEREPVANQTYIGRWVRWSGTILDIRSPSSFLKGGAFTVTVVAHTSGPAYAQLEFLSTERHLVEPLQEGDLISYEAKIIRVFNAHAFLTHVTFTQPERSVVGVTPEYLVRFFEEYTDIQAKTRVADFIGKWVKVSGPLGNVSAFPPSPTTSAQVTFADSSPARMFFRKKKWVDRLSILSHGDNITVLGRITYVERNNLGIDNCELIDSW